MGRLPDKKIKKPMKELLGGESPLIKALKRGSETIKPGNCSETKNGIFIVVIVEKGNVSFLFPDMALNVKGGNVIGYKFFKGKEVDKHLQSLVGKKSIINKILGQEGDRKKGASYTGLKNHAFYGGYENSSPANDYLNLSQINLEEVLTGGNISYQRFSLSPSAKNKFVKDTLAPFLSEEKMENILKANILKLSKDKIKNALNKSKELISQSFKNVKDEITNTRLSKNISSVKDAIYFWLSKSIEDSSVSESVKIYNNDILEDYILYVGKIFFEKDMVSGIPYKIGEILKKLDSENEYYKILQTLKNTKDDEEKKIAQEELGEDIFQLINQTSEEDLKNEEKMNEIINKLEGEKEKEDNKKQEIDPNDVKTKEFEIKYIKANFVKFENTIKPYTILFDVPINDEDFKEYEGKKYLNLSISRSGNPSENFLEKIKTFNNIFKEDDEENNEELTEEQINEIIEKGNEIFPIKIFLGEKYPKMGGTYSFNMFQNDYEVISQRDDINVLDKDYAILSVEEFKTAENIIEEVEESIKNNENNSQEKFISFKLKKDLENNLSSNLTILNLSPPLSSIGDMKTNLSPTGKFYEIKYKEKTIYTNIQENKIVTAYEMTGEYDFTKESNNIFYNYLLMKYIDGNPKKNIEIIKNLFEKKEIYDLNSNELWNILYQIDKELDSSKVRLTIFKDFLKIMPPKKENYIYEIGLNIYKEEEIQKKLQKYSELDEEQKKSWENFIKDNNVEVFIFGN